MHAKAQALIQKIRTLPADRLDEVEDFVDFIRLREQQRGLTRDAAAASVPALPPSGTIPKTTSTMPYEFGTIVLVPFPFTDQSASKRRPAVIVSNLACNTVRPDIVVMAVTSQLRATPALGEVWVSLWQRAGLLKASAIKPVFATIEQRLVIRRLGALQPADQGALRKGIDEIIG